MDYEHPNNCLMVLDHHIDVGLKFFLQTMPSEAAIDAVVSTWFPALRDEVTERMRLLEEGPPANRLLIWKDVGYTLKPGDPTCLPIVTPTSSS